MSWTSEKCLNILQHHRSEALICIVKYFWVWHLPNPHISSALKAPLRNEGDDDHHRWQFAIIHFCQLSHHFYLASLYLYQYKIFYLRLPNRPLCFTSSTKMMIIWMVICWNMWCVMLERKVKAFVHMYLPTLAVHNEVDFQSGWLIFLCFLQ